jgi:membrane protease subunit (stomatin/prohibitin family)
MERSVNIWDTLKTHAKAQFLDVIQWMEDDRTTVVYRFPVFNQAIQDGGKLVVREGQSAVFLNEGKLSEAFGPGTHEISTRTKALWSFFESIKYQLNYPFKGDIFFVSTRRFTEQKWGTPGPIPMMDPQMGPVRIRAFGIYSWRVVDPAVFVRELVGNMGLFSTDEIEGQLRRKLVSAFTDTLGETKMPVLELASKYMDLGDAIRERMSAGLTKDYGIQLTDFVVEKVTLPEDVEKMLDKRTSMGIIGDMNAYRAFEQAGAVAGMVDAAKIAAANPSSGGNPMMNAGMGLAMGQAFGQAMAPQPGFGQQGFGQPGFGQPGFGGPAPYQATQPLPSAPPPPPPVAQIFHYSGPAGQAQAGAAEIAAKIAADRNGNHMVWAAGFPGWKKWSEVPEIVALVPPAAPPPPPVPVDLRFHYHGASGQAELSAAEVAARLAADPNGRHLVWRQGMAGWTEAKDVPELRSAGGPPVPPPPPF